MIVSVVGSFCFVYREDGDPVFRPSHSKSCWSPPGWYGADSRLLHHVKHILNQRGYHLIKKRMWKDGHMFGTEFTQYLRSRDIRKTPSLCVYHANHAIEIAAEMFNKVGKVELAVEYGLTEEGDGRLTVNSRDQVMSIEAAHPCFEVSWSAPADLESGILTSGPGLFRHFKGFTDRDQALAWFDACEGEYPKVIDRRTGDRIMP